jgi:ribonuclease BN (tRNA processing enzyme)
MLLDSGPGTLRALLAHGVTYLDIGTICYTHLHCDHVADLAPILFAMRNMFAPRKRDLMLIGPPGFRSHYDRLLDLYDGTIDPVGYHVTLEEASAHTLAHPAAAITAIPMRHTEHSVGYRIEVGGKTFAFSGDTAYCPGAVELGRGCDLLALECSFPDGMDIEGHLSPGVAGLIASQAGCVRLLLTHLYPACEGADILGQCGAAYRGEIILAADGMRLEV